MKVHATKVHAIQDLPTIKKSNKTLVIFMINYLKPLIPSLSSKTNFLQEKLSALDWNPSTDPAF